MRDSVNQGCSRQPFIYAQKLAYDLGFRLENKDLVVDKVEKVKYTYGVLDADSSDNTIRKRAEKYGNDRFAYYRNIKPKPAINRIYNNLVKQNKKITKNEVEKFYTHLFKEKHQLDGRVKYFDGNYDMSQSIDRLYYGKETIKKHDIIMIKHEILEAQYMKKGMSYQKAHDEANKKYNYKYALDDYKQKIKKGGKRNG